MFKWSFNFANRSHRGLRHWIIYLLHDSPKNGVEIMDALETMSRGWWRPSPGSVYPLLDSMAKEGAIRKLRDKKYELTQAGKDEIGWPGQFPGSAPSSVADLLEQMSGFVSYLEDLSEGEAPRIHDNSAKINELADRLRKLGGP